MGNPYEKAPGQPEKTTCLTCKGTKVDPKDKKKPCPVCNGTGFEPTN